MTQLQAANLQDEFTKADELNVFGPGAAEKFLKFFRSQQSFACSFHFIDVMRNVNHDVQSFLECLMADFIWVMVLDDVLNEINTISWTGRTIDAQHTDIAVSMYELLRR